MATTQHWSPSTKTTQSSQSYLPLCPQKTAQRENGTALVSQLALVVCKSPSDENPSIPIKSEELSINDPQFSKRQRPPENYDGQQYDKTIQKPIHKRTILFISGMPPQGSIPVVDPNLSPRRSKEPQRELPNSPALCTMPRVPASGVRWAEERHDTQMTIMLLNWMIFCVPKTCNICFFFFFSRVVRDGMGRLGIVNH